MDESTYQKLADEAFRAIGDAFEDVDPEVVDCEAAGDVVTLTMRGGGKCIVNTQRPTRQIWLAAIARAWHFSWDEAGKRWVDDKGLGDELYATIARVVKQTTGADVTFA
ncbi:MAG TPA: iron donor protein CyaY [Polyangiaceae bacterium]|nr:iron donor protein CyaY [Polyangiaceae bacterium]